MGNFILHRFYRNTINFSLILKYNILNLNLLPNINKFFLSINLNNIVVLSDLRFFKSFYLILRLTNKKPYVTSLFYRYSSSKKIYNSVISLSLYGREAYNTSLGFSKSFFFRVREFFIEESILKFSINNFSFSISNINLWEEFENNPIFFKWGEIVRVKIFFSGNSENLTKNFLSSLKMSY